MAAGGCASTKAVSGITVIIHFSPLFIIDYRGESSNLFQSVFAMVQYILIIPDLFFMCSTKSQVRSKEITTDSPDM